MIFSAPAEKRPDAAYVDTLIREIEDFEAEDYEVVTVFSGEPSILPGEAILRLMEARLGEKVSLPGRGRNHAGSPIPELWMKKSTST